MHHPKKNPPIPKTHHLKEKQPLPLAQMAPQERRGAIALTPPPNTWPQLV